MSVFVNGECEPLKLAVHGSLGALAAVCLVYNGVALALRREPHLAMNVGLYSVITALELRKIVHHWQDCA